MSLVTIKRLIAASVGCAALLQGALAFADYDISYGDFTFERPITPKEQIVLQKKYSATLAFDGSRMHALFRGLSRSALELSSRERARFNADPEIVAPTVSFARANIDLVYDGKSNFFDWINVPGLPDFLAKQDRLLVTTKDKKQRIAIKFEAPIKSVKLVAASAFYSNAYDGSLSATDKTTFRGLFVEIQTSDGGFSYLSLDSYSGNGSDLETIDIRASIAFGVENGQVHDGSFGGGSSGTGYGG